MPPIGLQPSPPIPDGGGNGRPSTGPDQPQPKDPTTEPEPELPPKLELILCRICAVLKAGHNDHKRTQGEVAVVKDQLREVKDGLAKSAEVMSSAVEVVIARHLANLETAITAKLATNHTNLQTQLTTAFDTLNHKLDQVEAQQRSRIDNLEAKLTRQLGEHKAEIAHLLVESAGEEREESRADMTKLAECFGEDLATRMNQVVSTLDRHQAATKQSITDVEHRISTGNEAILDAHQTTAGQVDSIATANAATRGQLDSLDRLRDVPITEEVTTLHDLLADQLVQNDKGRWWIHEDLGKKIDQLGGVGGPIESVLRHQTSITASIQQMSDPGPALARLEQNTAKNATDLAALRSELEALRSDAPARMARAVREVVHDELAQHVLHSPSSSAATVTIPPPCPQASPPDRAIMPPRRTVSDTSSKTLVGPGPSQEIQQVQVALEPAQLASDNPSSALGPHLHWPAWMGSNLPDLSSEAMAVMEDLSQSYGVGLDQGRGWEGNGALGASVASAAPAALAAYPSPVPNSAQAQGLALATERVGVATALPVTAPSRPSPPASPAVPSSDVVAPQPSRVERLAAEPAQQSNTSNPACKPTPNRKKLPSTTSAVLGPDSSLPVLTPSRNSVPSTPARPPLAQLSQAPSPTRSARCSVKRPSTVLAPNSSEDELQDPQTLVPAVKKLRAPKTSAVAVAAKAKDKATGANEEVGEGGGSGGRGWGGPGRVTPASPAPSVGSVASAATGVTVESGSRSGSSSRAGDEEQVGDGMRTSKVARRTYKGKKRVMRTIPQSDDEEDEVVVMVVNRW